MNSGQSPSNRGRKLLDLLSQGSRRSRPSGVTGLANRIRSYVERAYIRPAREHGRCEITIRAGDIHADMGLMSRMPAVCGALGAKKFQEEFGVELVDRTGPHQGANVYFRVRILDGEPGIAQSEHQSAPARPPVAVSPSDKPTFCGQTRKVGNVPKAVIWRLH